VGRYSGCRDRLEPATQLRAASGLRPAACYHYFHVFGLAQAAELGTLGVAAIGHGPRISATRARGTTRPIPRCLSPFDRSGLATPFRGRRICPILALRFTPVGVRPTSPPSILWYNVFGQITLPRPHGGGPSRVTQTIASWECAASPRGQRSIARPNSSTISRLTTGPAALLRDLFKPFLAGASPKLASTAFKLLSCNQTRPQLRSSTAVASRKKACSASTEWFAASPRTFCSTRGSGANRSISDTTPNSALDRTSARYSASLESRASSGPKPLTVKR
jgi:hypothetical protein